MRDDQLIMQYSLVFAVKPTELRKVAFEVQSMCIACVSWGFYMFGTMKWLNPLTRHFSTKIIFTVVSIYPYISIYVATLALILMIFNCQSWLALIYDCNMCDFAKFTSCQIHILNKSPNINSANICSCTVYVHAHWYVIHCYRTK